MPETPSSCQSRSRSGGAAKSEYSARGVGAELLDHFVGRDNIAEVLGHFSAVFDDHALREKALDRFIDL